MSDDQDLKPLLDARQNHLSIGFDESNAIDTKAIALSGFGVAILIFAAQSSLKIHGWWLGGLMVGSLIISVVLGILIVGPWPAWDYVGAAVNLADHPEYLEMDAESLVLQLLADTELAIEKNQATNRLRWRILAASFAFWFVGVFALFVIMNT